jgi:hypothetical protein
LLERQNILLVASFGEGPFSVRLPSGDWRIALDSGRARLDGETLSGDGHHAIVLTR